MSQTVHQHAVMDEKRAVNISMPEALWREFDGIAGRLRGGQTKWIVATAAVLALVQMSEDERRALFGRVTAAELYDEGFSELVTSLKKEAGIRALQAQEARGTSNQPAEGRRLHNEGEQAPKLPVTGRTGSTRK